MVSEKASSYGTHHATGVPCVAKELALQLRVAVRTDFRQMAGTGEDGRALDRLAAILQVRGTKHLQNCMGRVAIVCQVWQRGGPLSIRPPAPPAVLRYLVRTETVVRVPLLLQHMQDLPSWRAY